MKLRKRLPESRSQKKERLAGERARRETERERLLKRREAWLVQQEEAFAVWREWRRAVNRRLESGDAYAHFEAVHRQWWDWIRHVGMPDAELTIAIQRWRDGLPFDPEPVVAWLEEGPRRGDAPLLRLSRRLPLDEAQKARLRTLVLRLVDLPYWHRAFRAYARLAPILDTPLFRAALQARQAAGGAPGCHADALLDALDQAARMRQERTPKP